MRLFLLALCTLALPAQTKINDPAAARKLLGPHNLTLQWLIFELKQKPGTVTVTDDGGRYKLKGDQRGKGTDFMTIDGEVLEVNALNFTFKGKIVSRVSHIADGKECTRDGTFQFRIAGARQFWRLRENQNPCDQVVDYIDIFFAGPAKN
jgi:hypothetical protein